MGFNSILLAWLLCGAAIIGALGGTVKYDGKEYEDAPIEADKLYITLFDMQGMFTNELQVCGCVNVKDRHVTRDRENEPHHVTKNLLYNALQSMYTNVRLAIEDCDTCTYLPPRYGENPMSEETMMITEVEKKMQGIQTTLYKAIVKCCKQRGKKNSDQLQ